MNQQFIRIENNPGQEDEDEENETYEKKAFKEKREDINIENFVKKIEENEDEDEDENEEPEQTQTLITTPNKTELTLTPEQQILNQPLIHNNNLTAIANPKFQEIFEQHRRIYTTLLEQQQRNKNLNLTTTPGAASNLFLPGVDKSPLNTLEAMLLMSEKSRTSIANLQQQHLQEVQKNFAKLEQVLRDELMGGFTGKIDKVGKF